MTGTDRDHGPQPLGELLNTHHLRHHDLVEASEEQVSHRMVTRAVKGRRLTSPVAQKVVRALNRAAGTEYGVRDAFNYLKPRTAALSDPAKTSADDPRTPGQ